CRPAAYAGDKHLGAVGTDPERIGFVGAVGRVVVARQPERAAGGGVVGDGRHVLPSHRVAGVPGHAYLGPVRARSRVEGFVGAVGGAVVAPDPQRRTPGRVVGDGCR